MSQEVPSFFSFLQCTTQKLRIWRRSVSRVFLPNLPFHKTNYGLYRNRLQSSHNISGYLLFHLICDKKPHCIPANLNSGYNLQWMHIQLVSSIYLIMLYMCTEWFSHYIQHMYSRIHSLKTIFHPVSFVKWSMLAFFTSYAWTCKVSASNVVCEEGFRCGSASPETRPSYPNFSSGNMKEWKIPTKTHPCTNSMKPGASQLSFRQCQPAALSTIISSWACSLPHGNNWGKIGIKLFCFLTVLYQCSSISTQQWAYQLFYLAFDLHVSDEDFLVVASFPGQL